jgi:N-acetylneuraminic acid mutarotase
MMGDQRATLIVFLVLCSLSVSLPNIALVNAAEDSWTTLAPLPVTPHSIRTTVFNETIYIMGITENGPNFNYQYDPRTNTWLAKTPMPAYRVGFALTAFQNKIYMISGFAGLGIGSYTLVYDPATDTWEQIDDGMPKQIANMEANVVDGKLYVIGGGSPINPWRPIPATNYNLVYDPETDSWSYLERMPTAVKNYASAVVDGKIYIIGGSNPWDFPDVSLDLVQIFDPKTNQWSQGTPIPIGVSGAAAGATTGELAPKRIYVFGGSPMDPASEPCNLTQVYNPEKDVWSTGAPMPTSDRVFGVAVINDELYVIKNNIEKYTPIGYIPPTPPTISIISPENKTYTTNNVSLTFTLSKTTSWIGYSLIGQENVTIAGNTTLTGLPDGSYSLLVYANDTAGSMGSSETVYFTITPKSKETFPIELQLTAFVVVVVSIVVGAGLLTNFKKRRREAAQA